MRVLVRIVMHAVLFSVVFTLSCIQEELFDLAKNGTGLVYVVTKDASSNVTLHVASDGGYYRSYYVGNTPNVIEGVFASRRGEIFILRTAGMYYTKGNYSDWSDEAPPFPGAGTRIFSSDDRVFAVDSSGFLYEKNDTGWSNFGQFTNTPPLAYAREGDTIYCVGNANTIQSFQINGGGLDSMYNTASSFTPVAIATTLFAYKNGSAFMIGGSNALFIDPVNAGRMGGVFSRIGSDIAIAVTGGSSLSYAMTADGLVFTGVTDGTNMLHVLRLSSSVWVNENLPFSSGTPPVTMVLYPMSKGKLAIWAENATAEDGIYIYNYEERRLKKLSQIAPADIQRVNTAN